MLYSEFISGTGCKQTEHNYTVYKNLEAMYMNTDLTKEEIYEYGKKLVDNSETPAEKQAREEKETLINHYKEMKEHYKDLIEGNKWRIEYETGLELYELKARLKYWKEEVKNANYQIRLLKSI